MKKKEIDDLGWKPLRFDVSLIDSLRRISGVYVIWEEAQKKALYVGRGDIRKGALRHLQDKECPIYYASRKTTCVAYASVSEDDQAGVENFLIQHYEPIYGQIVVNLPPFI